MDTTSILRLRNLLPLRNGTTNTKLRPRSLAPSYISLATQKLNTKIVRLGRSWHKLGRVMVVPLVFLVFTFKLLEYSHPDREPAPVAKVYRYDRYTPLIFIGGMPRSGTTLMRAMLDAHPDVRCGQETRIIPLILDLGKNWMKTHGQILKEAGIDEEVLNSAIAAFCLELIVKHGEPAPRLCNKDPFTLLSTVYLLEIFPQAKFIFMVRDGRATVHSIISRQVIVSGFNLTSYRQCMQVWNGYIERMYNQCLLVGAGRCMMVHYEQLVLHPAHWMREILKFLDVPWNETVLHHEIQINKPGGVRLSRLERSTDQVVKPVNVEALTKWVERIPQDVVEDMDGLAPMLGALGYDPYANPPNYGSPDAFVKDNMIRIRDQIRRREEKLKTT